MALDELNEYLECFCGRCDDGICRCSEYDTDYSQEISDDEIDYYDNPSDWD